jgi:formylglycine-generating enzyme required for sulfatase activity
MKLVRIEPGEFLMGSNRTAAAMILLDEEKPQHRVRISRRFFLGMHEVSQGQYRAVMGENPSHTNQLEDLPVERVSWLDAVRFCNKLSERELRACYYRIDGEKVTFTSGNGYRLPTEAEWEYACRAGSATVYPFGDDKRRLGEYAWYEGNSDLHTNPVGQKRANAWGLHDTMGNVYEWVGDWYDEKYYASSPLLDPPGAPTGSNRVVRGGSWDDNPSACRPSFRYRLMPGWRDIVVGFRVAANEQ